MLWLFGPLCEFMGSKGNRRKEMVEKLTGDETTDDLTKDGNFDLNTTDFRNKFFFQSAGGSCKGASDAQIAQD